MNQKYNITVVVATYNPKWEKLKATLSSIMEQQGIKLQIIVSDDGSNDTLCEETLSFFKERRFKDYKLIYNEQHEGTVINVYHGVTAADSEYIKLISPGDLLYDKTVLSKWLMFTKMHNAAITFGDAVFYNRKNNKINIIRHVRNPINVSIYKKQVAYLDRVINCIFVNDFLLGTSLLVKKSTFLYYLDFLVHRVIYTEDCFLKLAILDDCNLLYYPVTVIWYEYADGGISTSGDAFWKKQIQKDIITVDKICIEYWANRDKKIRSWLLEDLEYRKIELYTNKSERVLRYLKHPSWLYWKLHQCLFKTYSPTDVNKTFLQLCFDCDSKTV